MKIRRIELRNFRGFSNLVVEPNGHVVLMGEPRAGRSDLVEGLARALSPDLTRAPLTDDLDFHERDRSRRAEVEVTLGELGPALTHVFFDHLEFWSRTNGELVEELDDIGDLNEANFEQVFRLCYRAQWSDTEEIAEHWVDYPKSSDPDANHFVVVRRADRAELPVFFGGSSQGRTLSLAARTRFRRLVEAMPGDDFTDRLDTLLDDINAAAQRLGSSLQVSAALEAVLADARLPLDAEDASVGDLLRFAPEGGVLGAVLRSLAATLDLSDGAGFLQVGRHGSTVQALVAASELIAAAGDGVVVMDNFGEDLDAGAARHLAATLRKRSAQALLSTRRASVAEAFRPSELIRLALDDEGQRAAFSGWEPANKADRAIARHFALQVLPSVTASGLILLEGPHDRAAYNALAERLFHDEGVPLPAARRIAIADAGTTDQSGGSGVQPRIASALKRLGFFVVAVADGDLGEDAEKAFAQLEAECDAVVRLPDRHAIELAILDGLDDEDIRTALEELDTPLPPNLDDLDGRDLVSAARQALKAHNGLHAQFLDALPPGRKPVLAARVLETAISIVAEREHGTFQL